MRVIVGVCGSIAAYKAAELVRLLQQHGMEVEVAMTEAASRFVTPLTFSALSGHSVQTSLWQTLGERETPEQTEFSIDHIARGQGLDALIVAPATANMIAKLAGGIADDFISAIYLATTAKVFIAPAMNVNMWNHPATQNNVKTLTDRGASFIQPDEGYLACGMTGAGRFTSPESIAEAVLSALRPQQDLRDETILITAGGTREPIDPVRFIGNRSSGKMGYVLAEEAIARGAQVILITSSSLAEPAGCTIMPVRTAAEMSSAVLAELPKATLVIKAAAVADYRMRAPYGSKLHRSGPITLELVPTEDIVARVVAERSERTLVIAFAAETEDVESNAREKLLRKGADAIIANDVGVAGLGFDSERNAGLFITRDSVVPLPESSKREMARRILDEVRALRTNVLSEVSR